MVSLARIVLLCSLVGLPLGAQTLGSLRGQVVDPSGAVVPKATVTVSGPSSTVKVAETATDGTFSIAGLPAGKYTVRISATGFNVLEKSDVDLPSGRALTFDAKLAVASET